MSAAEIDCEERAKFCVEAIIRDADRDGGAYAPCFRDCLSDNRETAEKHIARAIKMAVTAL